MPAPVGPAALAFRVATEVPEEMAVTLACCRYGAMEGPAETVAMPVTESSAVRARLDQSVETAVTVAMAVLAVGFSALAVTAVWVVPGAVAAVVAPALMVWPGHSLAITAAMEATVAMAAKAATRVTAATRETPVSCCSVIQPESTVLVVTAAEAAMPVWRATAAKVPTVMQPHPTAVTAAMVAIQAPPAAAD